jgi:uncharacterized protein (TIGR02118 family)
LLREPARRIGHACDRRRIEASMVTSFSLLTRRSGSSEAEFRAHWRDVHAPLVGHVDYLRGYIQNRLARREAPRGINVSAFDGVAEFWWDDREAALRPPRDPRYTEHAKLDEPRFLDVGRLVAVQTTPVRLSQLRDPLPTGAAKALVMLHREPSLSRASFAELCISAWRTELAGAPGSVDCVLHLADMTSRAEPPVDAVIVCRWHDARDRHAWDRASASAQGRAGSDPARSTLFLADEHVVLSPPALP